MSVSGLTTAEVAKVLVEKTSNNLDSCDVPCQDSHATLGPGSKF
jgi:hypothetical protein